MSNSKLIDYLLAISFVVLFLICIGVKFNFIQAIPTQKEHTNIIIIDPGHGGFDPGKVDIDETILEKDINLSISHILKKQLEKAGYHVIMTRTKDEGLYNEGDSNKKITDMRRRVETINESNALLAVSIHQNSFTQASSKGSQVFYHSQSEEGKLLAETIQEQIKTELQDDNHRAAKSNNTYYMLKKTTCPIVIVECGFLSNPEEATLLTTKSYQKKMAKGICNGILSYLENKS
ncbi:N-acetylmuramoyl-L-alanine amidase CwlD [Velocimicrobium porci]|uniref:N-acetylmuramoyl-L-alanine amidase CwlD n=1 Tax=Velocimicrobium porci TaxID=2606634 RepID=A0A6L5XVP5_9FIRM|nr:N-acetylmuramoyl-L-alanine amidase CwlD [Velocimicrobium porci]MSS62890.1 N-acetylmuramoyl-L-alanine amidase CwlD [Velocimicrobium porci]